MVVPCVQYCANPDHPTVYNGPANHLEIHSQRLKRLDHVVADPFECTGAAVLDPFKVARMCNRNNKWFGFAVTDDVQKWARGGPQKRT